MDRKFELQLLIEHLNQERQAMFRRTRCPDVEHYLGPQVPPRPDYVLEDIQTGKEIAVERTSVFLRHEYQKYDVGWAGVREDLERNLNGTLPGLFLLLLPIKINYKQQSKHQLIDALKREIAKTSIKLAGVGQSVAITVSVNGLSPLYATLKKVNEHPSRIFVFPEKFRWFTPAPALHLAEILKKGFQHADTKFIGWESYERLLFIDRLPIQILPEGMEQCKEAVHLLVEGGETKQIDSVYVMRGYQIHRMC